MGMLVHSTWGSARRPILLIHPALDWPGGPDGVEDLSLGEAAVTGAAGSLCVGVSDRFPGLRVSQCVVLQASPAGTWSALRVHHPRISSQFPCS